MNNDNTQNPTSPIVTGSVVESNKEKGLTVRLDDGRIGTVEVDQISDVNIGNIESYFKFFPKYKFKILPKKPNDQNDELRLSYKLCHPKLVKDKRRIIPTCNHYSTLKKMIWFEIYLYDKQHQINELTTKKLNLNLDDIEIISEDDENDNHQ